MTAEIQDKLNKYCLINRKYQLLTEKQFLSKFKNIKTEYLKKAWDYSSFEIQNSEIIKNSVDLPQNGKNEITTQLKKFNFVSSELFYYLNSKFEVQDYKLNDERIERRLRNILALRHQEIVKAEIVKFARKQRLKEIKEKFFVGIAISIIPLLIIGFLFGSRIRDGFTPVDDLTRRIYEREIYEFDGSRCNDGSISHSQGRGTCSWHGGVNYKFYEGEHKKTIEQCRVKAIKRSWID